MRTIKKYANRKLYDTEEKKYISMQRLSSLIKEGEEVVIIENDTGNDITATIVSQLIAREESKEQNGVPSHLLVQLLRKGGGTVVNYAKRYTTIWQSALTMAEDEVDKLINLLVKNKEISESEGNKLKTEVTGYADNFKAWIGEKIDQRVNEALGLMNLATKEQIVGITEKVEELTKAVERLEKLHSDADKDHSS